MFYLSINTVLSSCNKIPFQNKKGMSSNIFFPFTLIQATNFFKKGTLAPPTPHRRIPGSPLIGFHEDDQDASSQSLADGSSNQGAAERRRGGAPRCSALD